MKRRRIILALALAAVVAGVAVFWPRGPREPVFEGEPLSCWFAEEYMFEGSPNWNRAQRVVRALGTNALPWLMAQFTRSESKWRESFNRWSNKHNRWRFRFRGDATRVIMAANGLTMLGTNLTPVLPELAHYLSDSYRGSATARMMAAAGAPALPYFIQGIASTNALLRDNSAEGLRFLVDDTPAAVPYFVQTLQLTNIWIRLLAAHNLRRVTGHPELTIPAVAAAVSDPNKRVRRAAAESWEIMRTNSVRLIPELRRQMQSTNPAVVLAASNALHLLQSTHAPPRGP